MFPNHQFGYVFSLLGMQESLKFSKSSKLSNFFYLLEMKQIHVLIFHCSGEAVSLIQIGPGLRSVGNLKKLLADQDDLFAQEEGDSISSLYLYEADQGH